MIRTALVLTGLVVLSTVSMAGVSTTVAAADGDSDDGFDDTRCGVSGPVVDEGSYSGTFDDSNDRASANLRLYEGQPITITLNVVEETDSVELFAHEEPDRGGSSIETKIRGERNVNVDRGLLKGLHGDETARFELWPKEDGYACLELAAADESTDEWTVEIERDGEDVALMDLRELEDEVVSLENELRETRNHRDELADEVESLESEVASLRDEIATLEAEYQQELDDLESEHEEALAALESQYEQQVADLESELASLEDENEDLQAEIASLEETVAERNETIESQQATIDEQAETIDDRESTIDEQSETIAALQSEVQELEETIDEHEDDDGSSGDGSNGDADDESSDDADGDRTPGFAIGVALIALVVVVAAVRKVR